MVYHTIRVLEIFSPYEICSLFLSGLQFDISRTRSFHCGTKTFPSRSFLHTHQKSPTRTPYFFLISIIYVESNVRDV